MLISGELIVSKYVAESITMIAGRFGHEGLCQLHTVLYAVDKGLRGRNVLQSLLLILLRICSRSIRPIALFCYVIYFCILPLVAVATKCPTPHWTPRLLQAQDTNGHNCLSSQLHVCTHRTVWMWRNSSPLHHNMKLTHRVYCVCVYMPNRFVLSIRMYTLHSV